MTKTVPDEYTGQEIFDLLMMQIEPELTSGQVDGLAAKYAGETPLEKIKRQERYNRAFAAYDKREAEFLIALHKNTAGAKRDIRRSAEQEANVSDKAALKKLESTLGPQPLSFLLTSFLTTNE